MPALAFPGCAAWWPRRLAAVLLALTLVVALAGCATTKASPTLVAGVTLDEIGAVYLQTGALYNDLYTSGAIGADEYREWAEFAIPFRELWLAARAAYDAGATDGDAVQQVLAVKQTLFAFALKVLTIRAEREKGTPS